LCVFPHRLRFFCGQPRGSTPAGPPSVAPLARLPFHQRSCVLASLALALSSHFFIMQPVAFFWSSPHARSCMWLSLINRHSISYRMASPRGRLQAAQCSSACFVGCTTTVVLMAATLEQSLHLVEAAAVTTTCASSKTAPDCGSGEVVEACTQRGVSISSLCYCVNQLTRYCSEICHGESTSPLCTSNCPGEPPRPTL